MRVLRLTEMPEQAPLVASRLHRRWWHAEGWTLEATEAFLRAATGPSIPIAYVAVDGIDVVGTATLDRDDLAGFGHVTPWLASVLVEESHRGRGIASSLAARAEIDAARLGYAELWLHTPDQARFWSARGFATVSAARWAGGPTTLMRKALAPAQPLVAPRTSAK